MENEETSTRHSIVPKGKRFIFSLSLSETTTRKLNGDVSQKTANAQRKTRARLSIEQEHAVFWLVRFAPFHQYINIFSHLSQFANGLNERKKRRLKAHINCLWNKRNFKSIFEHCFQLSTGRFSRILCSTVMKLKFMLQLWIFHPYQMNIESSKLKYATYSLFHDWCGTGEFASRWHFIHVSENIFARERKEMQFHGNRLN